MGRSFTPPYTLEVTDNDRSWKTAWVVKDYGRPTLANLKRWICSYERSLELGVNQHISKRLGYIPYVNRADIIRQKTHELIVVWKAPSFRVVGGSPLKE